MKLHIKVNLKAVFYQKGTLNELEINHTVDNIAEDGTEELKTLKKSLENERMVFEENTELNEYKKQLLQFFRERTVQSVRGELSNLRDTLKQCYLREYNGYVELFGYIINVNDFSAFAVRNMTVSGNIE